MSIGLPIKGIMEGNKVRLTEDQLVNLATFIRQIDEKGEEMVKTEELKRISKEKKLKKEAAGQSIRSGGKRTSDLRMERPLVQIDKTSKLAVALKDMSKFIDFDIKIKRHDRIYATSEKVCKQDVHERTGVMSLVKVLETGLIKNVAKRYKWSDKELHNLLIGKGVLYQVKKAQQTTQFIGTDFGYIMLVAGKKGMVLREFIGRESTEEAYIDRAVLVKKCQDLILKNMRSIIKQEVPIFYGVEK